MDVFPGKEPVAEEFLLVRMRWLIAAIATLLKLKFGRLFA
jgi:hypothetical protein